MHTKSLLSSLALVCIAGVFSADAASLMLNGDGSLTDQDTGLVMRFTAAKPGWHGNLQTSSQGAKNWKARFPNATNGEAKWVFGTGEGNGRTKATPGSKSGTVAVQVDFTAKKAFATELTMWSLRLPTAAYAGGSVTLGDKKSIALPAAFKDKHIHLGSAKCSTVRVATKDGKELVFSFPASAQAHLQDSRMWGVQEFSLRFFGSKAKFAPGDKLHYEFTVSDPKDALQVKYAKPTVIAAGPDWVPVEFHKNIVAGSALDLSNQGLQDAPAGKYGWTKVDANGHFAFEKLPGVTQRFYGVNLCFKANYLTHALTDEFITRLVRSGYNALRIHHYERDLIVQPGSCELRADQLDKFDYLMAKAIEAGIYVTTDIFVSRPITWDQIGLPERGKGQLIDKGRYKHLVAVWNPAFEDWKAFARAFLGHVNPYTGRAYVNEPALNLISLVNEGQLSMHWQASKEDPIIQSEYTKWLAERRAADPSFLPDAPTEISKLVIYASKKPAGQAMMLFMTDVERRSAKRMIAFLREMGSKALFTNANNGPHPISMQDVRADVYDYSDVHFYIDHPHFLEKPWSLPSRTGNRNPVLDPRISLLRLSTVRLADKPLVSTEWNFSGPGQYRGVGGIMTGACASLQDWDGLWRFAYAHSDKDVEDGATSPGYFNIGTDPLGAASDRASVCLFLRRDIAPLAQATALRLPSAAAAASERARAVQPTWLEACWSRRIVSAATSTRIPAGMEEIAATDAMLSAEKPPFPIVPNKVATPDCTRGTFVITTPRTAGGFTPDGRLDAGDISFTVSGGAATVWASSVDVEKTDLKHARRIVVAHVTDVQADGNVYADAAKTTLLKWGSRRAVARTGRAEVRLALAEPSAYAVWALDTSGRRIATVPSRTDGGSLVFTTQVCAPSACFFYEVVRGM